MIYRLLPKNYVDNGNLSLRIKVDKPKVEVSVLDKNGRTLFCGSSKCSPEDKWDYFIGVTLSFARLKSKVNEYFNELNGKSKNKKKVWIPKLGDVYYVPYMDVLTKQIYATKIVWTDGDLDFIRLSLGNIYRTEREARKAIRRNVLNGRHIVKENRNG